MSEFIVTNAPDPPLRIQHSCFCAFHSLWVHLGSFHNCMKLGAIRGELMQLMQKFVTRSHVVIFRNQRTQSTPLDPKLMFWCVLYHFGAFGTIWLLYQSRSKTKSRRNFSQRMHPVDLVGPQTNVLLRFLLFRCIWDSLVALRNSVQNGLN